MLSLYFGRPFSPLLMLRGHKSTCPNMTMRNVVHVDISKVIVRRSGVTLSRVRGGMNKEVREVDGRSPSSRSTMADCHFQYLLPRVLLAPMQRASIEFRRAVARASVFSRFPLLRFPYSFSASLCSPSLFLSLSVFIATVPCRYTSVSIASGSSYNSYGKLWKSHAARRR